MTIDLQLSLADLAGSVDDDELVHRLTAQVGPMVGRIRRRRAARATATGAVSLGTVAAVAAGAFALVNRDTGHDTRPAGPDGVPTAAGRHDGAPLECADVVPRSLTSDAGLELAGEVPATADHGDDLMTSLRWWAPGDEPVRYTRSQVDVAVVHQGVVVAVGSHADEPGAEVELGSTETGTVGTFASWLPLSSCDGVAEPLEPGSYQVVATVTLTGDDGATWRASAGPWALVVTPPGDDARAAATAEAEAAVQEIIAAAPEISAQHPFGTCGTWVPTDPADDAADPAAVLDLELDLDSGTGLRYTPGDAVEGYTILTPADGRESVLGDFAEVGATVVLVRDGVVVGRGPEDDGGRDELEVTQEAAVFYGTGEVRLCSLPGADAPELDLPPGFYQAYAVLPARLRSSTDADGATQDLGGVDVVVRSAPVDVIVQRP